MPIIISQNCGASELILNNKNGYVFNPLNKLDFLEIITNINEENYLLINSTTNSFSINNKDKEQVLQYDIF